MSFDPISVAGAGFGLSDGERAPVSLKERFVIPPFSVLRAMDGDWMSRKRAWLSLGIQSEVGRGENVEGGAAPSGAPRPMSRGWGKEHPQETEQQRARKIYDGKKASPGHTPGAACDYSKGQRGDGAGKPIPGTEKKEVKGLTFRSTGFMAEVLEERGGGTSIFDPVLCELAYRWWCPAGGSILDPFSGGSVRGIVAAMLERQYTGIDLRPEQIEANEAQWGDIGSRNYSKDKPAPKWVVGDSQNVRRLAPGEYDFVFSCPPYGDLEVYSDNPHDLSTMPHEDFIESYRTIIARSCSLLKDNRFACFVVGDFRDKQGFYRNFVSDTIAAFEDAGVGFYNEGILVTAIGSLPVRIKKQFNSGRKLGKTHQNILVFYKGDPKKIKEEFGEDF